MLAATAARDRLDEQINRLGCLRGISALTGLALTVEIGDWSRFTGSSIGAYVGTGAQRVLDGHVACSGVDHQGR